MSNLQLGGFRLKLADSSRREDRALEHEVSISL